MNPENLVARLRRLAPRSGCSLYSTQVSSEWLSFGVHSARSHLLMVQCRRPEDLTLGTDR